MPGVVDDDVQPAPVEMMVSTAASTEACSETSISIARKSVECSSAKSVASWAALAFLPAMSRMPA